jgi:signal transduction histidine kinase
MVLVAAAMFGLIAVLATLQYRWLGQISAAERERMRATLATRAAGFAQDFDRELTRAYLLFQVDAAAESENAAARLAARHDRWQATARFPRLIGAIHVVAIGDDGSLTIKRFDPTSRFLEPSEWPAALGSIRDQIARQHRPGVPGGAPPHPIGSAVLDDVPAIVVPTPFVFVNHQAGDPRALAGSVAFAARLQSWTILVLDREYVVGEMLPALAAQHFRGTGDGFDYRLAVVRTDGDVVYQSAAGHGRPADRPADAEVDLFAVRQQEFSALAAEVRRFVTFFAAPPRTDGTASPGAPSGPVRDVVVSPPGAGGRLELREGTQLSILVKPGAEQTAAMATGLAAGAGVRSINAPKWKLLATHPAGSLEAFVQAARRRNVLVSSGILALLGASMALLVLSAARAQRLAARQMEFVAAVSHEFRTPLAVIRSAGENLADGVVQSDEQVRQYGDLVRSEGRRLTEMVEQTLELAGIQSGQRGFALRPVALPRLIEDLVESSRAIVDTARVTVEVTMPAALPPVLGDEPALRRLFQNLLGNAVKYGAPGGWVGVTAEASGREVRVTVADRGIGIAPAEHTRIFEPFYRTPDAVAAQVQGAGLGLSLVKRIVEAHGGRITLTSEPGRGSAFTVQLPAAGDDPIGEAETGGSHEPAAHAAGARS